MTTAIPTTMRAMAIRAFGGTDMFELQTLPVPALADDELLIRLEFAGVGAWDPFEREGGYAQMLGVDPPFPYVLGSEGAGVVLDVGARVTRFWRGDRVYAAGFLNPKGGFYAEHVAVAADLVSPVPAGLPMDQAAALSGVGLTALRGLEDTLEVQPGEAVLIYGASGGMGHVAVQLAKRMGARVLAVASGADGVALVQELGADAAVDGRTDDVLAAARTFAPSGMNAALFTVGGELATRALAAMQGGGRVAFPGGVELQASADTPVKVYNGEPDADILARLYGRVTPGPFRVHISRAFDLHETSNAHQALGQHHVGKIVLRIG